MQVGILTAGWGSWREEIEEIESLMVALQGFGSGNERPALSAHDCKDSDLLLCDCSQVLAQFK